MWVEVVASTLAGAPRSPSPHRTRTAGYRNQRAHPCAHQEHARTLTHSTDRNDAPGLAYLARTGFFKPVHMRSLSAHALRSLIIARKKTGGPIAVFNRIAPANAFHRLATSLAAIGMSASRQLRFALAAVFQRKQREGQNRGSHPLQTESNRPARDTTCMFFTRVPNAALSLVTTPPSAVQALRCWVLGRGQRENPQLSRCETCATTAS